MLKHTRNLLLILIAVGIVVVAAITLSIVLSKGTISYLKIKKIDNESESNRLADYSESKLYLHKNGTFDIQIIYVEETVLTGIGTWVFENNEYSFFYIDCWAMYDFVTRELERVEAYIGDSPEIYIRDGRYIKFIDPNGFKFYFK